MLQARRIEAASHPPAQRQIDRHISPPPKAVNPPREVHALADLQAFGEQGGAGVVAQLRPGAVEWPPMRAPIR